MRLPCAVPLLVLIGACGRIGFGPRADDSGVRSCASLPPTCGADGNTSCCDSSLIEGGTFHRRFDHAPDMTYADMSHPATMRTFRLDTYEVTVGRFRQFVAAGMGTQANPPMPGAGARPLNGLLDQGGWDPTWNEMLAVDTSSLIASIGCDAAYGAFSTWTEAPGTSEHRPINCVTWYEAFAFCVWDGGFLSAETEVMFAGSAGSEQRAYPWSSPPDSVAIDCTLANHGQMSWPETACTALGPRDVGSQSPAGDGAWGHADLSGNVWEWQLDVAAALTNPCDHCANLVAEGPDGLRIIRGGAFNDVADALRVGSRYYLLPTYRYGNTGFRCSRPP